MDVMYNSSINGIKCPTPIKDKNGQLINIIKKKSYGFFKFINGNSKKVWSKNNCFEVGKELARFHNVNKNLDKIEGFIKKFNLHLIHTHINNFGEILNGLPTVIELSFSKYRSNDKTLSYRIDEELPLSIDEPNDENGVNYIVKFK